MYPLGFQAAENTWEYIIQTRIYIYVYTVIYIYISRFSTKVRIFQGFFELDGIHSNLLVKRPQD